jgi:hypothetical protein
MAKEKISLKQQALRYIQGLYTEVTLTDDIRQDIYEEVDAIPDVEEDTFTLVEFPRVQKFQGEDWFKEEAHPTNDGAYFIPTGRLNYAEVDN